jgi:hypothetical protein
MTNTNTQTEASAVQDVRKLENLPRTHAQRVKKKLSNPYISEDFKKIILRLETLDVLDALHILRTATELYALKLKEIIKENTK